MAMQKVHLRSIKSFFFHFNKLPKINALPANFVRFLILHLAVLRV